MYKVHTQRSWPHNSRWLRAAQGGCQVDSIFGKRGLGGKLACSTHLTRPGQWHHSNVSSDQSIIFKSYNWTEYFRGVQNYCAEKIFSNLWSPACCFKDIELCCWSWSTERLHRGHVTVMLKRQATCIWYTCKFRPICSTGSIHLKGKSGAIPRMPPRHGGQQLINPNLPHTNLRNLFGWRLILSHKWISCYLA